MSNFDSTKNRNKNKTLSHKVSKKLTAENDAKNRWSTIQSDLGFAASEWTASSPQEHVKTPEEVQLEKVKNMIEDLKDKLNEF